MRYLLKTFVLLLFLYPAFAAEQDNTKDDIIDAFSPSHVIIKIPKEENTTDTEISISEEEQRPSISPQNKFGWRESDDPEQGRFSGLIDTLEEVENAQCTICCLRTARTWGTGATGLFGFLGGIGNTAKTTLTTLSVLGEYSSELKKYLGITSTVVNASALIANKISSAASFLARANQKELQDIEDQIAAVLKKYQGKQSSPLFKASPRLSKKDQKTIINLQERYKNITSLNGCEKGCFSFLNSFFSYTSTFSQIMEFICNTGNLVMVPIATLPVWDSQTARALSITVIVIESASVFFNQWSQQAHTINKKMTILKNDLDKYN